MVDAVPLGNLYSTKHVFSCVPSDGREGRMHGNTECFQMCPQIACLKGCKITLVASVELFSTMGFLMSPQRTWNRAAEVTLVAFV